MVTDNAPVKKSKHRRGRKKGRRAPLNCQAAASNQLDMEVDIAEGAPPAKRPNLSPNAGVGETRERHVTRVNKSLLIELPAASICDVPVVEGVGMGDEPSNPQLPEKDTEVCVVLNQEPSSSTLGSETRQEERTATPKSVRWSRVALETKRSKATLKSTTFRRVFRISAGILVMRNGHWP